MFTRIMKISMVIVICFSILSAFSNGISAKTEQEAREEIEAKLVLMHQKLDPQEQYELFIKVYNIVINVPGIYESMDQLMKSEMEKGKPYSAGMISTYLSLVFNDIGEQKSFKYYSKVTSQINQMTGGEMGDFISKVRRHYQNHKPKQVK